MTADLFAQALEAHLAGDLAEAERLYGETVAANPRHAKALSNLAVVRLQQGRAQEGVEALRQSLLVDPAQPVALTNLGAALRGLSQTDEALEAFRRAVAMDPGQIEAWTHLAALLLAGGRLAEAAEAYGRAAAIHPQPGPLRHAQALALHRLGRPDEALGPMRQAVELQPDAPGPLNDLGVVLEESGHFQDALDAFDRALALKPDYAEAMNNRALAVFGLGRLGEAAALYDAALAIQPDYPVAWYNRADVLAAQGRFEEALTSLGRAIAVDPGYVEAWVRRGDMLGYLRRLDEAETSYARARELDPAHVRAAFHLALPLLREGRYAEGLPIYEHRWSGPLKEAVADLPRPIWLGGTSVPGKTILLHSEQGHGDTLMMLRYAPLLARQGARVILSVQAPLESLAAEVEGVSAVIPHGQALPPYDLHTPMMSLPLAFGTTLETVPGAPWLRAPQGERARWAARLGPRLRPRVGLCWSGSPLQKDDRWRSLPLGRLAPLFDLDADLFALQTEINAADRAALSAAPIDDLSGELSTYADTAAVMEQMDLIVTVCTSAANLAGGLGRPALVMLGAVADWRWGLEPHRSPWFPSLRLLRQERIGEWGEVVDRAKSAAQTMLLSAGA